MSLPPLATPDQGKNEQAQVVSERHEVVVTATKLEVPARQVASSMTIFAAEALERSKKATLAELLAETATVSLVQNGGPGATASLFIRGANSEHSLVLVDGIELNDPMNPSRSADLAYLTLENVERVEILRGPQSPLYGSDAMGGVVNILTRQGSGKPRLTLSSSAGSYRTLSTRAEFSGSTSGLGFSLGLQHWTTRGVSSASSFYLGNSEKDASRNLSLSGRLSFHLRENVEADFLIRSTLAKLDVDNYGGPYGDDPNNTQDYRRLLWRAQIRALFLKNRWEQKLVFSLVDSRRDHKNPADENHPDESETGLFKSRSLKLDWQNNFFVHPAHTLTVGFEHEQERGESEYLMVGPWGDSHSDFPFQKATTSGIYVQDHAGWADRLFATVGFRYDRHSLAGDALTYRVAPAFVLKNTQTKIKGSLGTGFKSPSLYQLYAPATFFGPIGNASLRPEKTLGWDFGLEQPLRNDQIQVRLAATYFHNTFRDLINFEFSRGYVNIGKAMSRGLETEVAMRLASGLSIQATYVRLEARDQIKNSDLLRRPKSRFSAVIGYTPDGRWDFSLSFLYTGKRKDVDYSGWEAREVILPAYKLINGMVACTLNPNLELFVRLDNLLNARYETIYGYGTLGFSLQAGAKISL